MALSAKELGKPVYVVAESFKFTREFPLNQRDIPANFKVRKKSSTSYWSFQVLHIDKRRQLSEVLVPKTRLCLMGR